jgi:predicted acylesterase/phospholipase RssA
VKEFTETLRPALQGKDMNVSITLQEFYERTGIEVHFIVTELNKFVTVDFNHKTHPTQSLVEACYMSCCYPFVFAPIYRDGGCYADGAIINDYPVNECLRDQKCLNNEILGIKMLWERKPAILTEKSSVLQFMSTFFNQMNANLFESRVTKGISNEVVCVSKIFASQDWINCVKDENYRRELMLRGETFANVFLSYRRNFNDNVAATTAEVPTPSPVLTPSPASILDETEIHAVDHDIMPLTLS